MTSLPPPGWYADPVEPERQRYWDGEGWSDDGHAEAMAAAAAERAAAAAARAAAADQTLPAATGGDATAAPGAGSVDGRSGHEDDEPLLRPPTPARPYGAPTGSGQAPPVDGPQIPNQHNPDRPGFGPPPGQTPPQQFGQPYAGSRQPYGRPQRATLSVTLGGQSLPVADWWQRGLAWLLDIVIVGVVGTAATLPFFSSYLSALGDYFSKAEQSGVVPSSQPQLAERQQLILSAVVWLLMTVYCAVQHRIWGRTIGKRALGLRVRSGDGTDLSWGQAAVRAVLADALILVPGVGLLWALFDRGLAPFLDREKRRTLHDRAAGTVVVRQR